jgi:hypothetical protein
MLSKTIEIDGINIFYREAGDPAHSPSQRGNAPAGLRPFRH